MFVSFFIDGRPKILIILEGLAFLIRNWHLARRILRINLVV
jgi:hypothetical protein